MPDIISPILRRSFPFRAIAHDASLPSYDYAQGLAGSQAMFMVLKESAVDLADPARVDAPIEGVIVMDADYKLEYVEPKTAKSESAPPAGTGVSDGPVAVTASAASLPDARTDG